MNTRRLPLKWIFFAEFFLSVVVGWGLAAYFLNNGQQITVHATRSHEKFTYIHPLLDVGFSAKQPLDDVIQADIEQFILRSKQSKLISNAGVYFKNLTAGRGATINADLMFSPGNLLKVPIMIAYFKIAEKNPAILDERFVFRGESLESSNIFHKHTLLQEGTSYSVDELIKQMIVNGDRDAALLLFNNIDKHTLNNIFSDLGIQFNEQKNNQDFISLRQYSLIYRVLFNATYLTSDFSEKALVLLIDADNSIGIGAGLPKNMPVANRFGGRIIPNNGTQTFEVHDCGIVYMNKPYLLCAAVQGVSLEDIKDFLKNLGQKIYFDMMQS